MESTIRDGRYGPGMTRVAIAGVAALGALAGAGQARAEPVAVLVVPAQEVWAQADRGAIGLFVPGAGATVTREQALRSLTTGRSVSGPRRQAGPRAADRGSRREPGPLTIYVALPPPGRHHNVTRYPVAIVGGGFRGILDSPSTRLPGLVSIADVAPTAVALEQGTKPVLGFRPGNAAVAARTRPAADPRTRLPGGRNRRPRRASRSASRPPRSRRARAGWRAPRCSRPRARSRSRCCSPPPASARRSRSALAVAAGGAATAFVAGRAGSALRPVVALFLAVFLVVLAAFPETNALAAIGPHPDGGVRFFGVTNQVETLLLAPVLAAAATSRRWLVDRRPPRARRARLESCRRRRWRRAGVARRAGCARRAGRAAARLRRSRRAGGSRRARARAAPRRHRRRPGRVEPRDDRGRRRALRASRTTWGGASTSRWAGATASWHAALLCAAGARACSSAVAVRAPRHRATTAFLVALAVSLVVNDSPVDELVWGAIGAAALLAWENASSARRSWSTVPQASPAPSRPSA